MRMVALWEVKAELSKYLHVAEKDNVIITKHGRPAGVLTGFANEDDWFEYKLVNDPRFLKRISRSREQIAHGKGAPL